MKGKKKKKPCHDIVMTSGEIGTLLLGDSRFKEHHDTHSPLELVEELRKRAGRGDETAQHGMAMLLDTGRADLGIQPNPKEAIRWCKAGVEAGDARAQFMLAQFYMNGYHDVPADVCKAVQLLNLSREQGHIDASFQLGLLHKEEHNFNAARHCFDAAARHGHVDASVSLAQMLTNAEFGHINLSYAERLLRFAHKQGSSDSWVMLKKLIRMKKDENKKNELERQAFFARAREADRHAEEILMDEAQARHEADCKTARNRQRKKRRASKKREEIACESAETDERMDAVELQEESKASPPTSDPPSKAAPDMSQPIKDVEEPEICAVCHSQVISHALAPCGHMCVCASCAVDIFDSASSCPICKASCEFILLFAQTSLSTSRI